MKLRRRKRHRASTTWKPEYKCETLYCRKKKAPAFDRIPARYCAACKSMLHDKRDFTATIPKPIEL